ncbi:MAG: hypothetical protein IOC63_16960 [Methylobacterium sp.]|nr:hypothetical protein [Methylobacterium sp.]
MELLDALPRLAPRVPPLRMYLTRYHGVFARHSMRRAAVMPASWGMGATHSLSAPDMAKPPTPRGVAML